MRDPQRIDAILDELSETWKANPDWRLGQLIYNAARAEKKLPPCPELFYMEDDEMAEGIKKMPDAPDPDSPGELWFNESDVVKILRAARRTPQGDDS